MLGADDRSAELGHGPLRRVRRLSIGLNDRAAYALGMPLLTLLNAVISVTVPGLLDPVSFGGYVLLLSIFQLVGMFDLGLSQITDKMLTKARQTTEYYDDTVSAVLWVRLVVAAAGLTVGMLVTLGLGGWNSELTPVRDFLAVLAGVAFMLANGPVSVYRASLRGWKFTIAALTLQAGGITRLAGLLLGGLTGCLAMMAGWNCAMAIMLNRPVVSWRAPVSAASAFSIIRTAIPLFAFNGIWLCYLSANRLLSSMLSDGHSFGLFAFGASLTYIIVGSFGTIAAAFYPRWLTRLAESGRFSCSAPLADALTKLSLCNFVSLAVLIVAMRPGLGLVFPRFSGAAEPSAVLLISCLPLSAVAWTMPMAVVLSRRPAIEATKMFVPPILIISAGMTIGNSLDGISGQAWACVIAALVLLAGNCIALVRWTVLHSRTSARFLLLQTVLAAVLGMLWVIAYNGAEL